MQLSQPALRPYAQMKTMVSAVMMHGITLVLLQRGQLPNVAVLLVYRAGRSHLKILNAPRLCARCSQTAAKNVGLRPV